METVKKKNFCLLGITEDLPNFNFDQSTSYRDSVFYYLTYYFHMKAVITLK
jgi:hypothetical protein